MAEKTLVYRINFDGLEAQAAAIGKVDGELTALNQTISTQRKAIADLRNLNQQGTQDYADLTAELGKNIVQQRATTKAKGDLIRETQNEAKVLKENEGSIVSLRAQLSNLTKEYNNLTRAERESAKGKDVQNQAKAISDELKKLESAVGNTSRNVGNYKEALGELELSLKQLLQAQAAARKSGQENNAVFVANEAAIQALAQEYQVLAQSEKEVDDQLKNLTASENEAGASAESLKSKLRALKEAAAVAGEGTEDFQRLTAEAAKLQDAVDDANEAIKQEKGTEFEKFREQLGGVGQSLGNLDFKQANERITQLGGTLKGLTFDSLKEGIKGATSSFAAFGKVLLSNPIFLIAAIVAAVGIALFALKDKVAIIGQAFDALTLPIRVAVQAFKDLGDAIGLTTFAADEAVEKQLTAYTKLSEELSIQTKRRLFDLQLEIDIRKAAGKDFADLEQERVFAIKRAADEEFKIQRDRVKLLEQSLGAGRKITQEQQENYDKEVQKLNELGFAYEQATSDANAFFINKQRLQQEDLEKQANEGLQKQKEINAKALEERKKANELLLKLQQENDLALIKDKFETERIIADIEFEANKKSVQGFNISNELKLQLLAEYEEKYLRTINAISASEEQSIIDAANQRIASIQRIEEQGIGGTGEGAKAPDARQEDEAERQQRLKDERTAELQANVDQANAVFEIAQTGFNALAALKDQETQKNIDRITRERDAQLKAVQDSTLSEEAKAKKIAEINAAAQTKLDAERKKNAESQKRLALIQIALDTGKAIAAAIATGAATAPFPANIAAIASGIAAVVGGIVSATAAVNSAKFALGGEIPMDGGFITGNSHAKGGVKFSAGGRLMEAEGGEIIVNKGIQKRPDFVRAISQMNYMTGGKKFETGGIVAPVFSAAGASLASQEQNVGQGFTFEIPPIQVLNNVVDTTSQQSSIIQIQNQTSIGG